MFFSEIVMVVKAKCVCFFYFVTVGIFCIQDKNIPQEQYVEVLNGLRRRTNSFVQVVNSIIRDMWRSTYRSVLCLVSEPKRI